MTALTDARARLAAGYYNSNPISVANPGGFAANGHQVNYPAACLDLGLTLTQAGIDAAAFSAAMPTIAAGAGAAAAAATYRDQAKAYRDQAEEIVGVDISGKANLNSPALTGTPTAPTPAQSENSTRLATTAYVVAKFAALVGAAPGTLDALNELAAALGNDPNFATSMATALGLKLDKAGGMLTGDMSFADPTATQRNIVFNYAIAAVLLYANNGAVGLFDNAAGAGEVWTYSRSAKTLNLKAGATAGGSTIWTGANLSPVDLASAQNVTGSKSFVSPNQPINSPSGPPGLMVAGSGSAASMAFHRPGLFATYFGIDTDNQLKLGGWSNGANAYVIYHQGNDGAGSGMDADFVRGLAPSAGYTASSLVARDAGGSFEAGNVTSHGSFLFSLGGGFTTSDGATIRVVGDKALTTGGAIQGGTVTATSDLRLKSDVRDLEPVAGLVPRRFRKDGLERLGYIAQEVLLVAPEAVHEADHLSLEPLAVIAAVHAQLAEQIRVLEERLKAAGVGA